ncbi:MAG: nuclear transport factor 2 family protein [Deltaproteobacteria bacterium]|nr:nuclear transport factor 2 family protein [Deltaproteobacteria bacterium]
MSKVTPEMVAAAYGALASGDMAKIRTYWAEDLKWFVPGHNIISGWKRNLGEFVEFMVTVGRLSDNSFHMENITTCVNDEYSADVTRNRGHRAGNPNKKLDIVAVHVLRWKDGKVIEGRGAIEGDGTAQYDQFWSPVVPGESYSEP